MDDFVRDQQNLENNSDFLLMGASANSLRLE